MGMLMRVRLMEGVVVVMRSVLAGMVVIMHVGGRAVSMFVAVLVEMFVRVAVSVLMAMLCLTVCVLVRMGMSVVVGMQMFVLVCSFHGRFSCS
jgi:hypothetical protein